MHAPAVFRWTADANPVRHRKALARMGVTREALEKVKDADLGRAISDQLLSIMAKLKVSHAHRFCLVVV